MKFGQTPEEAAKDTRGSGSSYMKVFKDGDAIVRLLQEPNEWVYFWDHYDPSGFSYPCTNDQATCPGCTSNNERVKRAGRKVAFNLLEGEYVNVYKVPPLLADKLKLRYERLGSVTDRDYTITRYQTGSGDKKKTEYDVDGGPKHDIDLSKYELKDIEAMLAAQYEEAWGDGGDSKQVAAARRRSEDSKAEATLKERLAQREDKQPEDPPSKPSAESAAAEGEYSEHYLRSLGFPALLALLGDQANKIPGDVHSTDELVDWIIANQ